MATAPRWGTTPRRSVEAECARRGRDAVVAACLDLLAGRPADPAVIVALGGPPARWAVHGGEPGPDYWLRVWALRGLLWAWDDDARPAVVLALGDSAWRVREMAAKVAARHAVGEALPSLARLQADDAVPRVRRAAERAVLRLTAAGA